LYKKSSIKLTEYEKDSIFERQLGKKFFELTNHLGNVLATINDRKIAVEDGSTGVVDYYLADIQSSQDYYAFGMMMPGRSFSPGEYRFGFQGQEKDDEVSGTGNSYTAQFWQYDPRLGRRWNVDPVVKFHESPYAAFANNPIWFIDPFGADSTTYLYSELDKNGEPIYKDKELQKIADMSEKYDRLNGIDFTKYKVIHYNDLATLELNPYTDNVFEVNDDYNWPNTKLGVTNGTPEIINGTKVIIGEIRLETIAHLSNTVGDESLEVAGYILAHERLIHAYSTVIMNLLVDYQTSESAADHRDGTNIHCLENSEPNFNNLHKLLSRDYDKMGHINAAEIKSVFEFANSLYFRWNSPVTNIGFDVKYKLGNQKLTKNIIMNLLFEEYFDKFIRKDKL